MSHNERHDEQPLVDLEEYAQRGERPPRCERYRIRIDRERFVVLEPCLAGRELLVLAGKCPPERYRILQRFRGGKNVEIKLDEKADFTTPGVERFVTLPLDQHDGESHAPRL